MLDARNIYHTGYPVSDMETAQRTLTEAIGIEWAPVHVYDPLRLWQPGLGWSDVRIRVSYSRPGPHQLELIEGPPGSFFDPDVMPGSRHLGMWAEDLGNEVERLLAGGWQLLCAKGAPEDRYGDMAYMRAPKSGPTVELVSTTLRPMLLAWFVEPFPD